MSKTFTLLLLSALLHTPSHCSSANSSCSRSSGGGGGGGGSLGGGGGSQPHSPTSSSSYRYRTSLPHQPQGGIAAHRLSSVSSHDSGFVSQDANIYSKPPSPMPSDITSQVFCNTMTRTTICGFKVGMSDIYFKHCPQMQLSKVMS